MPVYTGPGIHSRCPATLVQRGESTYISSRQNLFTFHYPLRQNRRRTVRVLTFKGLNYSLTNLRRETALFDYVHLQTFLPILAMLVPREIPAGTHLEVRLTSPVGTYASTAGSPVSAVLTAPVMDGDIVLLAAGSSLTGTVKSVRRVGLGIVHETSAIELVFDRVEAYRIRARVIDVDNARE